MNATELEFDALELYSDAFGKYNQDSMIMDVCRLVDSTCNESITVTDIDDFTDKEKITLFHEYTHVLHATTTIFGLSYFNISIALWHAVRSYHDVPDAAKFEDSINAFDINSSMTLLKFWRNISTSCNQKNKHGSSVSTIKIKSIINPQPLRPIVFSTLDNEKLELGFIDISECAAFLLEQEFSKSMGIFNDPQCFNVFPYKIAIAIAKHINSGIKDGDIIYYLLASLQTHDPAYIFVQLLRALKNNKSSRNVREQLAGYVKKQIRINKKWVSKVGNQVQKGFPLSGGFIGNAVKSKFKQISDNLLKRRADPFFEINFAQSFSKKTFASNIFDLTNKYGSAIIVRSRKDKSHDDPCIDVFRNLGKPVQLFEEFLVYAAANSFIMQHIIPVSVNSFTCRSLRDIPKNKECIFYTSCTHSNRKNYATICKNKPWNHPSDLTSAKVGCFYQKAQFETNITYRCT